jgi:ribosomal protein S14
VWRSTRAGEEWVERDDDPAPRQGRCRGCGAFLAILPDQAQPGYWGRDEGGRPLPEPAEEAGWFPCWTCQRCGRPHENL